MPFTFAHPAMVLPLRLMPRKYLSMTALIIGSIAPDMEYFLRLNAAALFSHSIKGIFLFDLPVTIILAWLWHSGGRRPVIYIPFLKARFRRNDPVGFSNVFLSAPHIFIANALAGICLHILLDSFTHPAGYFARSMPALLNHISIGGWNMRLCYWIWYLLSVIGFAVVMLYLIEWRRPDLQLSQEAKIFWSRTIFVAIDIALIRIAGGLSWNTGRHLVIIAMGALLYAWFLIALTMKRQGN